MSYNNVRKKVEYKNILIVENDAELREKLYNYFAEMNTVTAVSELKKAVEAVQNIAFDIKFIKTDRRITAFTNTFKVKENYIDSAYCFLIF